MSVPAPPDDALLERTRSAVLNVLVGVGAGIAATGLILRWRDRVAAWRAPQGVERGLQGALFLVVVASYLAKRLGTTRSALRDPARRSTRFYRAHVLAAAVAALAVPLGLAYGWLIRPTVDGVSPFWVAALALGILALPRAVELEGLEGRVADQGGTSP